MHKNIVFEVLLDKWHRSTAPQPDDFYAVIEGSLTSRNCLHYIDVGAEDPDGWTLTITHSSKLIDQFVHRNRTFQGGSLASFTDPDFVQQWQIPQYLDVIDTRQPLLDTVWGSQQGIGLIFDRLILPDKSVGGSKWLISCIYGHLAIPGPRPEFQFNDIDEIIMLMCAAGETARTIAKQLKLSPRTIEHRLDKLKKRSGARSVAELTALAISSGLMSALRSQEENQELLYKYGSARTGAASKFRRQRPN